MRDDRFFMVPFDPNTMLETPKPRGPAMEIVGIDGRYLNKEWPTGIDTLRPDDR